MPASYGQCHEHLGVERDYEANPLVERAGELLRQLAGPDARLRSDHSAAIEAVAGERRRTLVVQRTGFGKWAIYFIATRPAARRRRRADPCRVAVAGLMRDQVAAADRMGVRSATIDSTNLDEWTEIEASLAAGATSGRPVGQNVAPLSISVTAALLAQYVSFSVAPGVWATPARCSTC